MSPVTIQGRRGTSCTAAIAAMAVSRLTKPISLQASFISSRLVMTLRQMSPVEFAI